MMCCRSLALLSVTIVRELHGGRGPGWSLGDIRRRSLHTYVSISADMFSKTPLPRLLDREDGDGLAVAHQDSRIVLRKGLGKSFGSNRLDFLGIGAKAELFNLRAAKLQTEQEEGHLSHYRFHPVP
jgi:hypothetical protein